MSMLSSGKLILLATVVYLSYTYFLYVTNRKKLMVNSTLVVLWFLLFLGSYSVFSISKGIVQFNNSPDAYNELQEELKEAEVDLKRLGFSFSEFDIKLTRHSFVK
ncbi:uncharacterized protein TOT_040000384 [Theileria orientalis strain Shintoku]|uniref:Dolichol-phosphate mannosyltransferase subunit 3 n=1 Tax=Theileria orientalis strain Shintoku TaxID=869250 RepID=J4CDZ6_THEOR|nr:uncharacterized protein TOT_040000384 [Theileria orientalis strain Shintoku]BAM42007.1 uncharacterized protein TOT_040000384 [Theileria orientalis strain Shintoku]|eukprot:XP_009692308.1 uncharacterized protein TOT_040000384 [Theileria orientalis strain Shintoku]